MKQRVLLATTLAIAVGWQIPTPTAALGPSGETSIAALSRGLTVVAGAGHYLLQQTFDVEFAFAAIQFKNGPAFGHFRHRTEDETGTIDFTGAVTCLAVDWVNRRAWIGGVITANSSTAPAFSTLAIHEEGHDIWFRVLDNGHGGIEPDRSTFVGFESEMIPTSEAYCAMRIWPDIPTVNARTWPVTSGNLLIHP
jgi:hypothetical protein